MSEKNKDTDNIAMAFVVGLFIGLAAISIPVSIKNGGDGGLFKQNHTTLAITKDGHVVRIKQKNGIVDKAIREYVRARDLNEPPGYPEGSIEIEVHNEQ